MIAFHQENPCYPEYEHKQSQQQYLKCLDDTIVADPALESSWFFSEDKAPKAEYQGEGSRCLDTTTGGPWGGSYEHQQYQEELCEFTQASDINSIESSCSGGDTLKECR